MLDFSTDDIEGIIKDNKLFLFGATPKFAFAIYLYFLNTVLVLE